MEQRESKLGKLITGDTALTMSGLLQKQTHVKKIATWRKHLNGVTNIYGMRFLYSPNVDNREYTKVMGEYIVPIKERALVEYILNEDNRDEGTLIWALQNYIEDPSYNFELLLEVSQIFNLEYETLMYWLNEARDAEYFSIG